MANIYTGNGLKIFYNEDTAIRLPHNAGNEQISEIAAMPTLHIKSAMSKIETYNSEYVEQLAGEQNIDPVEITVNYIPGDYTHTFLDEATGTQKKFQLILIRRHSEGTLDYSLMNGRISAAALRGDKDSVVQKTYTFTPTEMIVRDATALASVELYEGSYGVGSNGVDVPQYEPLAPKGNSFIKIPAVQAGNPVSVDMMGVGLVDGNTFSSIAMTKSGSLAIYAKNQTTAWTRILTSNVGDLKYVALTGNQSIDGVKTFIKGIYVDSLTASNGISGKSLAVTEGITADNITVTKSTLGVASADSLTLGQPLSVANGGTGAKTPADARKALGVNAAGTFDIVPVLNGGTGATTPIQARLNLGIGSTAGFEVLPIENGGTGAVTALGARNNLELGRIVQSTTETTVQSPDGEKHLTIGDDGWGYWNNETNRFEPLFIGRGGTGATDVASAKINLQVDRLRQQENGTFLTSPDYNSSFFVYNGADWGCIDSATAQVKPLLINYGGTGATDLNGARINLQVNRFNQMAGETMIQSPDTLKYLTIGNDGWGYWNTQTQQFTPLGIIQGGTGATTATGARANLELSGFITSSTGSTMRSPNSTFIFSIDNNGNWGATERNVSGWKPLGIAQGGTGATTAAGARTNLGLDTYSSGRTQTINQSPNKENYLYVNDSGGWGAYSNRSGVGAVALGVGNGGTGGRDAYTAATNLHTYVQNVGSINSGTDFNNHNGIVGTAGVISPVNNGGVGATNFPTNYRRNNQLYGYGGLITTSYDTGNGVTSQMYISHRGQLAYRMKWGGTWIDPWNTALDNSNTTIDSNGFIKAASPIVKVFADGSSELNSESEGVVTKRVEMGVYEVLGTKGLNQDGWTIEIPQDVNGNRLCFVETSYDEENEVLTLRTFTRKFDINTAMVISGEPMEIPSGRWIDLRVEMPEDSIYNTRFPQSPDEEK